MQIYPNHAALITAMFKQWSLYSTVKMQIRGDALVALDNNVLHPAVQLELMRNKDKTEN